MVETSRDEFNKEDEAVLTSDPRARSLAVKALSRRHPASLAQHATSQPPRVLLQYWDTPDVPSDVAACMTTWNSLIAYDFQRLTFDRARAREFIGQTYSAEQVAAFDAARHPAIRSDYFRLCYIAARGGWYVDADDAYQGTDLTPLLKPRGLRLQALCYDLDSGQMVDAAEALAGPDGQNVIHYVNNDPLIARPEHPILIATLKRATTALLSPEPAGHADVQAIAGPGAITLELARQSRRHSIFSADLDVEIITDWDGYARPVWDLAYRRDGHDWRLWNGRQAL